MKALKITRIKLHNFKGFENLDFKIDEVKAIILGGKNGFGKTSLFDAVELVLTGEIARYRVYKTDFFDNRSRLNDIEIPLVYNKEILEVQIDLYITQTSESGVDESYILTRKSSVRAMQNPIDFSVFSKLYYRSTEKDNMEVISDEKLNALGLRSLINNYDSLYYISQEEAVSYLKMKGADRAQKIQSLFNTSFFDDKIQKIDKLILPAIKQNIEKETIEINRIQSNIDLLNSYKISKEPVESVKYTRLFVPEQVFDWDNCDPDLSSEQYHDLLKENGILDQIYFFILYQDDFKNWKQNEVLNRILTSAEDFIYYIQYLPLKSDLLLYKSFEVNFLAPYRRLELSAIRTFTLDNLPKELLVLFSEQEYSQIQTQIRLVKQLYSSSTELERINAEIIENRNSLAYKIQQNSKTLGISKCPLCGHDYQATKNLIEHIEKLSEVQSLNSLHLKEEASTAYGDLIRLIDESLISKIDKYFNSRGITKDFVERYEQLLHKEGIFNSMSTYLEKNLSFTIERTPSFEETYRNFLSSINALKKEYNTQLNYVELDTLYNRYCKYLTPECKTLQAIQSKKDYLLSKWNTISNGKLEELIKTKMDHNLRIDRNTQLKRNLEKLKNEIKEQKNGYLINLLSDIEILFYIYSGRIMQDCYFGRGLFVKINVNKSVSFVTDYKNDVDALYKMSSGQLVALVISFLLTLNKLYADTKFLAIDDPIQTIDDINIWGLMDTLKNEFRDYSFIFSTHEVRYGSLLRYKLSNMGISSEYRDMMAARTVNA